MCQKFKGSSEDQHSCLGELCRVFKTQKTGRYTAAVFVALTALLFLRLKDK
jgi:hypothetical protein